MTVPNSNGAFERSYLIQQCVIQDKTAAFQRNLQGYLTHLISPESHQGWINRSLYNSVELAYLAEAFILALNVRELEKK